MSSCACMGPQRGAPLCPCRMREAKAWLERSAPQPLSALQLSTVVGGPLAGWHDAATAPRDGCHILACNAAASFGWMDGKPLPPVQTVVHWFPDPDDPGFYTSVNELEPQRPFQLTHWKSLDSP